MGNISSAQCLSLTLSDDDPFVLYRLSYLINTLVFAFILVVQKVNHPLLQSVSVCHFLASVSSLLEWDSLLELELISRPLSRGRRSAGSSAHAVVPTM